MTLVKICGITNLFDALAAVAAGANALGFIFAPSPREISPEEVRKIVRRLPPFVMRVGVITGRSGAGWHGLWQDGLLDLIQVHGEEKDLGLPIRRVIKALAVGRDKPVPPLAGKGYRALLLDTYRPGQEGGTGRTFPWEKALPFRELGTPLVIAGGLRPENIRAALETVRPSGVDVGSGVESKPGRKDRRKMEEFIRQVRAWDSGLRSKEEAEDGLP